MICIFVPNKHTMMEFTWILLAALSFLLTFFLRKGAYFLLVLPGLVFVHFFTKPFSDDPSAPMIQITLLSMLVFAALAAFLKQAAFRYAGLLLALLAVVPVGAKVTFGTFEIDWSFSLMALAIYGAVIPFGAAIATKFLGNKQAEKNVGEQWASLLLLAPVLMFANFQATIFGVFLVLISWYVSAIAKRSEQQIFLSLGALFVAFGMLYATQQTLVSQSFLAGNWWMGLVAGFAALGWYRHQATGMNTHVMQLILVLVVLFGLISLGILNEHFGGLTALSGVIIGAGIALWVPGKKAESFSLFAIPLILVASIPVFESVLKPEVVEKKSLVEQEQTPKDAPKKDVLDRESFALNADHAGKWKSIAEFTSLNFELGPEGSRTQGAFKKVDVSMDLSEAGAISKLEVAIRSKDLTTFNDLRDESVLGDGYIKSAKFPAIHFSGKTFTVKADRTEVSGELEFMGVKKAVTVLLKCIAEKEVDGKKALVFVGRSSLNRTDFGMKSDAKIGDVVDLTFELTLKR